MQVNLRYACGNEDGQAGAVSVTLDADSAWTLTADSHITAFEGDLSQVQLNGFTLDINGTLYTGN